MAIPQVWILQEYLKTHYTHYNEECKDLSKCKSIQSCIKRQPKGCKKFANVNRRFGSDCANSHHITENEEATNDLKKESGDVGKTGDWVDHQSCDH